NRAPQAYLRARPFVSVMPQLWTGGSLSRALAREGPPLSARRAIRLPSCQPPGVDQQRAHALPSAQRSAIGGHGGTVPGPGGASRWWVARSLVLVAIRWSRRPTAAAPRAATATE